MMWRARSIGPTYGCSAAESPGYTTSVSNITTPDGAAFAPPGLGARYGHTLVATARRVMIHGQGLADIARNPIERYFNPQCLSKLASYDVASNVSESLCTGARRWAPGRR
jgi:hypothetical protein